MGDRQRTTSPPAECPREGWAPKILAAVGGLVLGLVGGVLGTVVSPIGEGLREQWSPTVATVSGHVVKNGAGIWAQVQLDAVEGSAPYAVDTTDDWGGFGFDAVVRGPHAISILEDGETVSYHREFTIGVGERAKELGAMDLAAAQPRLRPDTVAAAIPTAPAVAQPTAASTAAVFVEETMIAALPPEPMFEPSEPDVDGEWLTTEPSATVWATLIEPTDFAPQEPAGTPAAGADAPAFELVVESEPVPSGEAQAHLPPGARRVSLWVAGSAADLALIDRVTYALPETFNPNIVTRYDPDDGFLLAIDTGETMVTATIYFADGTSLERDIELIF